MALLSFPPSPNNGDKYPINPLPGQSQYEWSSTDNTWRLLGPATTVTPGCYGDAFSVPSICIDSQGRIVSAVNTKILTQTGTVTDITAGLGLTGGTITTSGTIALDTAFTDSLYLSLTGGTISGNLEITGSLEASGLSYPTSDGASGDVLTTDGAGTLGWSTPLSYDLQTVTDNGSTTTNNITLEGGALSIEGSGGNLVTNWSPTFNYTAATSTFANPNLAVGIIDGSLTATRLGGNQAVSLDWSGLTFNNGGGFGNGVKIEGPPGLGIFYTLTLPENSGGAGTTFINDGTGKLSWGIAGNLQQITNNGATTSQTITAAGIQVGDGSAVAPSVAFSSSPNSGLRYQSTDGTVDIIVSGNEIVSVGSTTTTFYSDIELPNGYSANFTGILNLLQAGGQVRFYDSDNSNYVGFRGPVNATSDVMWRLPSTDGTQNQVLATSGFGNLKWLSTAQLVPAPASSVDPGTGGQIAYDTGFFYWHDGVQWLRVAGSTF